MFFSLRLVAQNDAQSFSDLESRVSRLESKLGDHSDGGLALYLFGAFCALWAQTTGRNAWLWFFLGFFFNIITVLVLLAKNSKDRERARLQTAGPPSTS
jgi:hypothetical protein